MSVEKKPTYKIVTSRKQVGRPRPLRKKLVILDDVKSPEGDTLAFYCFELTALDFAEWRESEDNGNADLRFLAETLRDADNNKIYQSFEEIKADLGPHGRSSLNALVVASNEMNFSDPVDAEKNSEKTESDSSPSN
jgi:hypothetical protein